MPQLQYNQGDRLKLARATQVVDELHSGGVDIAVVVCLREFGNAADHWIETVVLARPRTLES